MSAHGNENPISTVIRHDGVVTVYDSRYSDTVPARVFRPTGNVEVTASDLADLWVKLHAS